uniref:Uncharacterized protein n=2 Tax=unclassified Candidatus Kentrum TaxID=2643149 RepID=A0A450XI03_9GAMM|nr:MAG: hypothetical protein BECKLPF1236A_GA0070988_100763 [Candidatus Kentron sp. LPFa]VFK28906.1 MAG: hypothetical protein BECKLPF1236C_GA0070990_100763 [Candidatus Kentron sp. LPFa]VFK80917.1 MAG: hypothetical protein BECKSD772D_GA0070982_11786 [Candidatus Kentron sp. SD]
MSSNREATNELIASAASKVLRDSNLSKSAKVAAGSALSQRTTLSETASSRVASAASRILRDSRYSKSAKTSAGLALTQRPDHSK